eukprot:7167153-Pyramimonas_sp.AAC.2
MQALAIGPALDDRRRKSPYVQKEISTKDGLHPWNDRLMNAVCFSDVLSASLPLLAQEDP